MCERVCPTPPQPPQSLTPAQPTLSRRSLRRQACVGVLIRWQACVQRWAGACERVCLLGGKRGCSARRTRVSGCAPPRPAPAPTPTPPFPNTAPQSVARERVCLLGGRHVITIPPPPHPPPTPSGYSSACVETAPSGCT